MTDKQKIRVLFVIPTLDAGGAERVISFISQNLDKTKFESTLLVIGHEMKSRYRIDGIQVIFLNKSRVLYAIPAIFNLLSKSNINISMSAIRHLNVVMGFLSIFFPKIKFVGREVNVISVLKGHPQSNDRHYPQFLINWSHTLLDAIVCQSQDMFEDLKKEHPRIESKLVVINNPITDSFKPKGSKPSAIKGYQFITVGSLEPRKGHPRILSALSKLEIPFKYLMIGVGSQEKKIKELISRLNLEQRIEHIPFTKDIDKYLKDSHVFLQGSFVEGFPNALLESCAVGTPVIAFNAPGGINEIIENKTNGFIVENEIEFLNAIKFVLDSNNFNPEIVSHSVFKKYNSNIIIKKYEALFLNLMYT
jgi:glycosyltransferase involved in cell wall biosynthesis